MWYGLKVGCGMVAAGRFDMVGKWGVVWIGSGVVCIGSGVWYGWVVG